MGVVDGGHYFNVLTEFEMLNITCDDQLAPGCLRTLILQDILKIGGINSVCLLQLTIVHGQYREVKVYPLRISIIPCFVRPFLRV